MLRPLILMVHGATVALSSVLLGFLWQDLLTDWIHSAAKVVGLSAVTVGFLIIAVFRSARLLNEAERKGKRHARQLLAGNGCSCCGRHSPPYREAELTMAPEPRPGQPPPPSGLTIIEETFYLKVCQDCYRMIVHGEQDDSEQEDSEQDDSKPPELSS